MSDSVKTLDEIVQEVVWNKDIHDLMADALEGRPLRNHAYKTVFDFQVNQCAKAGLSFSEEGYQVGEPWDGDISQAPILFLSSNPACDLNEVSPRYHAETGKVLMPDDGREMSLDDIKTFLRTRIQTSPGAGKSLHIPLLSRSGKKTKAVHYWGSARNNTQALLPATLAVRPKGMTPRQHARIVMKYAVCMEIVPFRSLEEIGVPEALNLCWQEFTRHILAHAAAPVFVLVGEKARDKFVSQAFRGSERKARKALNAGGVYPYVDMQGRQKLVVYVPVNRGHMRRFGQYFPKATLNTLKAAVAGALVTNSVN